MSIKTVLVVDDDWDIREALHDILAFEGYQTAEAVDGTTALLYLRSHPPPGLILLDWNMAPMNGLQFLAECERDPSLAGIPVVLLTADMRAGEKVRSIGFVGLLKKPVAVEVLIDLVSRYCASPAASP
jgi:CheY-like chemotaxis protein